MYIPLLITSVLLVALPVSAQTGAWETTFGESGKVLIPTLGSASNDQVVTGAVQPDGRIVLAARSEDADGSRTVLLRFLADGSPDMSFGDNGVVVHDLSPTVEFPRSLVIDGQGRYVVGGYLHDDQFGTDRNMFIARFLPDGSLDPSFAGSGLIERDINSTPLHEEAREVLVQPDGKLLLCGYTGPAEEETQVVIERYLENGGLDPSFGGDGSIQFTLSEATAGRLIGATLGPNGNIYFCGDALTLSGYPSLLLGYLEPDGSYSSNFGNSNGVTLWPDDDDALSGRAIALLGEDRIVVAGVHRLGGFTQARKAWLFDLDGDWLDDVLQDSEIGEDAHNALAISDDGKIFLGGNVPPAAGAEDWHVEQLEDLGSDLSYNEGFQAPDYDEAGGDETCNHLVICSDGSVLGIGRAEVDGLFHIAMVKYANGINTGLAHTSDRDASFAMWPTTTTGTVNVRVPSMGRAVRSQVIATDGRCVLDRQHDQPSSGERLLQLDLSALANGAYMVIFHTPQGRHSGTILKL